ncbi:MAG: DUF2118 domain-containing protein [Sulfolobales archaeon]|nr:DUF2118 domain-containing protein [Sulfolobales archaeon]MDW8082207.1 DUF2118 domain-containing protein [Sulfolobales archaeon]
MSLKPGEASVRVLKDLEEVVKYYKPTECFRDNVKVECHTLALQLLEERFSNADLRICNRRKNVCVDIAKNSKIYVVEVSGAEVYPQVDVGDYVRNSDLLAYVVTNKGEVRSSRSSLEGYVLLIHEDPLSRPLKCFVVVAREGVVVSGSRES